ncbi:hypothetical protein M3Y94_00923300 [Aphelenchoides besseyi]|nr:hypothetical protein M3Y94_00923300 [Aphelenchoides besseyi]
MLRCWILIAFAVYFVCDVGANDSLSSVPQDTLNNNHPNFVNKAIETLWEERKKMKYTPLEKVEIAGYPNVEFYFKLEYNSTTGNLKHRFAWCLFVWAITEGYVKEGTPIYEASSGNTATSEAYFAQLLGLPFVAVVPNTTAPDKIEHIKHYNGTIIECAAAEIFDRAAAEAKKHNGFFMNQFVNANPAEEYRNHAFKKRGLNSTHESVNVLYEIAVQIAQMNANSEVLEYPDYIVHSAGTGGKLWTLFVTMLIARNVDFNWTLRTKIPTTDSSGLSRHSIFNLLRLRNQPQIHERKRSVRLATSWNGRHRFRICRPGTIRQYYKVSKRIAHHKFVFSLQPAIVDRAFKVADLASTAGILALQSIGNKTLRGGTSSGLNFVAALAVAARNKSSNNKQKTKIAVILGDNSDLYTGTYLNESWIDVKFAKMGGIKIYNCWLNVLNETVISGRPQDRVL